MRTGPIAGAALLTVLTLLVAAGCASSPGPVASSPTQSTTSSTHTGSTATPTTPTSATPPSVPPSLPLSRATTPAGTRATAAACLRRIGAHATVVPEPTGPLSVSTLGRGRSVVITVNESDQDQCGWVALDGALARAGHRVISYDGDVADDPVTEVAGIADWARRGGASSVQVVGASQGAKEALVAAAGRPWLTSVISLSAEEQLAFTPVGPYVEALRVPTLFVTAENDPYGATGATEEFAATTPAKGCRLIVVPGNRHGTALLDAALTRTLLAWTAAHD